MGWVAQAVIWYGTGGYMVVALMIIVSSPVQSFEIWSSTGLSLDNSLALIVSLIFNVLLER